MKKIIIVVAGTTPKPFEDVLRDVAWTWVINPKKLLKPLIQKVSQYVDEGDVEDFTSKVLSLRKKYSFERKYVEENIERFKIDESPVKEYGEKTFDTFVLCVEDVSLKTLKWLVEEGAYSIYVGNRETHTEFLGDGKPLYDFVLNYDDEDFEISVHRIVNILAGKQQEAY